MGGPHCKGGGVMGERGQGHGWASLQRGWGHGLASPQRGEACGVCGTYVLG